MGMDSTKVTNRSNSDLGIIEMTLRNTALTSTERMDLIKRTVEAWDTATAGSSARYGASKVKESRRYPGNSRKRKFTKQVNA